MAHARAHDGRCQQGGAAPRGGLEAPIDPGLWAGHLRRIGGFAAQRDALSPWAIRGRCASNTTRGAVHVATRFHPSNQRRWHAGRGSPFCSPCFRAAEAAPARPRSRLRWQLIDYPIVARRQRILDTMARIRAAAGPAIGETGRAPEAPGRPLGLSPKPRGSSRLVADVTAGSGVQRAALQVALARGATSRPKVHDHAELDLDEINQRFRSSRGRMRGESSSKRPPLLS